MTTHGHIRELLAEHEAWRKVCLNLIASENALSPAVRGLLDSDLVQRYGNYQGRNLDDRRYTGNRLVNAMEKELLELIQQVFHAREIELRPVSGHVAGLAVIMGVCNPGDTVLELSGTDGGHRLAYKAAQSPLIDLRVLPLPHDPATYNLNGPACCELIRSARPRLVILGSSNFLFPHPVREIADCLSEIPGAVLAYDASHVLGLIACGEFQDPLAEGAQVVFGSTHKTLPGPQGGVIYSNDGALLDRIATAVYPGIVTNHHLTRGPALATALLEMLSNPGYAKQVIANAQALGRRLSEQGLPVVAASIGCTRSHTVLVATPGFASGQQAAQHLESGQILTSYTRLPEALGAEGIRLGTAEVTRMGAVETDLEEAAGLIAEMLHQRLEPEESQQAVKAWAGRLPGMRFTEIQPPYA